MTIGLHRVENEDGLVEWAAGEPSSATRGRVVSYIGYRESAPAPVHRWETPAGEVSLIVSLGPGFRARAGPDAGELSEFTSFVVGMHDRPSPTVHDGRQLGMQVRLDPLGAFSLFGVPVHELGNRVVGLSDLLGADAERWTGMLLAASAWEDRFALLDRLLAARMSAGPTPSPELVWAWRTMQAAAGAVRVTDLADGAGCSQRHLVTRFREQIGATPKTAARVLRYARAARLLADGQLAPAQVAALCGYADQSHLTREFTRFAGTTPGATAEVHGLDTAPEVIGRPA